MNLNHEQRLQPLERADAQARKEQPAIVAPLSCADLVRQLAASLAAAAPIIEAQEAVVLTHPGASQVLEPLWVSLTKAGEMVQEGITAAQAAAKQLQPTGAA